MKNAMSKRVIALVMMGSMMGTTVAQAAEVKKDESVYVTLGSTGNLEKATVSDWLHSEESGITVFDKSELKNIKNVKSDVTPEKNGENLIWDMDGNNIYYQGTTNKDIPLDISIKYYYEDKEIDPEDLAGKSGKVRIEIDVKNKEYKEVDINGKMRKIYTPFVVAGEITLPNDKFKDVSTEGATTISEGNNILVAFAKMPGLSESLELDSIPFDKANEVKDKADILNDKKIVVEAEAEEFSLGPIMLTATADTSMLGDLDGATDLTELKDKLDLMQSSYNQILEGETQIRDGIVNGYAQAKSKIADAAPRMQGLLSLINSDDKVNRSRILLNDAYEVKRLDAKYIGESMNLYRSPEFDNKLSGLYSQGMGLINDYDQINKLATSTKSILGNKKVKDDLLLIYNDVETLEKEYSGLNENTKKVLKAIKSTVTLENMKAIEGKVSQLTPAQEALKTAVENAGGAEKFVASLRNAISTLKSLLGIDFQSISTDISSYGSAYLIIRGELMAAASSPEPQALAKKQGELKAIVSGIYSSNPDLVSQLTSAIDGFSKNLTKEGITNDCLKASANKQTLGALSQGVQTLKAFEPLLTQIDTLTSDQDKTSAVLNILTGNDKVIAQLQGLANAVKGLPENQKMLLIQMLGTLQNTDLHLEKSKDSIALLKSSLGDKGLTAEEIDKVNNYADQITQAQGIVNSLKIKGVPSASELITTKNKLLDMANDLRKDDDILKIMNDSIEKGNVDEARKMLKELPNYQSKLDELNSGIQQLSDGMQQFKDEAIDELHNKGTKGFNVIDELSLAKDEITNSSKEYGCFSGQDESVKGSTKFIMKTKEIKYEAPKEDEKKEETTEKKGFFAWIKSLLGID